MQAKHPERMLEFVSKDTIVCSMADTMETPRKRMWKWKNEDECNGRKEK